MPDLARTLAPFNDRLAALVGPDLPGMSIAVLHDGDAWTAAAGTANLDTSVPVEPRTKFLVGSNSKTVTAALVLQLVDDGLVDLDDPVVKHLPELHTASPLTDQIRTRDLVGHTSGLVCDWFRDFGRGDDAIERYVASLAIHDLAHEPGRMYSYSNAGMIVAGRLVEVLRGQPWHEAVRDRILAPLELAESALFPEESILGSTAVGHVRGPAGSGLEVTSEYLLPHAMAPTGSALNCSSLDVAAISWIQASGGLGRNGQRILSEEAVALMADRHADFPFPDRARAMGLGWATEARGDRRVLWHNGATTGQVSSILVVPDARLVLVAQSNFGEAMVAGRDLINEMARELVGLPLPDVSWTTAAQPHSLPDLRRYEGVYERFAERITIRAESDHLVMVNELTDDELVSSAGDQPEPTPLALHCIDETHFRIVGAPVPVSFLEMDEDGRPEFVFLGRASRRTQGAANAL